MDAKPSLALVLQHYGYPDDLPDWGYNRSIRCPFHDDRRESASYNAEEELFRCFTCGVQGDVYAIVMQHEDVDFVEAKRRAEAIAGQGGDGVRKEPRAGRFLSVSTRAYKGNRRGTKTGRSRRTRSWS